MEIISYKIYSRWRYSPHLALLQSILRLSPSLSFSLSLSAISVYTNVSSPKVTISNLWSSSFLFLNRFMQSESEFYFALQFPIQSLFSVTLSPLHLRLFSLCFDPRVSGSISPDPSVVDDIIILCDLLPFACCCFFSISLRSGWIRCCWRDCLLIFGRNCTVWFGALFPFGDLFLFCKLKICFNGEIRDP